MMKIENNSSSNYKGDGAELSRKKHNLQMKCQTELRNKRCPLELEKEAETIRKLALCLAFMSLLTAVLLPPLLISNSRIVQSVIDWKLNACLDKLAGFYNRMDHIVASYKDGTNFDATKFRSTRHVIIAAANRKRLRQTIHRKARYLQLKLAETAALLNSREIWNDANAAKREQEDNGERENQMRHLSESHFKDIDKSNERGDRGVENGRISSSFEISSEHYQRNKESKQQQRQPLNSLDSTTPLVFSSSPANDNGNKATSIPFSKTQIKSYSESREQGIEKNSNGYDDDEQCNCSPLCVCVAGRPGPAGLPGADGLPGRDGCPGKDGMSGADADGSQENRLGAIDFCYSCAPAPAGNVGLRGHPGFPGQVGRPGEDGAEGRKGLRGKRGPEGVPGQPGKQGIGGAQGVPGRIIIVQGPVLLGVPGLPGLQGLPGILGSPGLSGVSGPPGPIGEQGIDGRNGAQGIQGIRGEPGKEGLPGSCGHCTPPRTSGY